MGDNADTEPEEENLTDSRYSRNPEEDTNFVIPEFFVSARQVL